MLGVVCIAQVVPSEDVIAAFKAVPYVDATETNVLMEGAQQTDDHALVFGVVLAVQVMPSGEVIAPEVPVVLLTATYNNFSYAQQTELKLFVFAAVRIVHVIPSGDVITVLDEEVALPTATNK